MQTWAALWHEKVTSSKIAWNECARRGFKRAKMPGEKVFVDLKKWNSLTWCSASNRALSAEVEETWRNGTIDPGSSRDRRSTWIQMRGKQKPSSPKPREKDDILQLASIKAKCTTETECRFKANCCLKLPLAESCLWRAKKSVGTKEAFPVSRSNVEFPFGRKRVSVSEPM